MPNRISLPALAVATVLCVVPTTVLPGALKAQDAAAVMARAAELQASRWAGVENYTVDQSISGNRTLQYFERMEDGGLFRLVPLSETQRREAGITKGEQKAIYEGMAMGAGMLGPAFASEVPGPMGLEMMRMMGEVSYVMAFAAEGVDRENDGRQDARDAADDRGSFARMARLVGRETVDGAETFHLRVDDPGLVQSTGEGTSYTVESVSLWMDAQAYVPRRTLIQGTLGDGQRSSPLTIEVLDQDYRPVGDMGTGPVYEPHRRVMRLDGIFGQGLSEKEQREMEEAREKMKELEMQLAQLPPEQQAMIKRRLAPQLAQMKQMQSGGAIEAIVTIHDISLNAGPPDFEAWKKTIVPGQGRP